MDEAIALNITNMSGLNQFWGQISNPTPYKAAEGAIFQLKVAKKFGFSNIASMEERVADARRMDIVLNSANGSKRLEVKFWLPYLNECKTSTIAKELEFDIAAKIDFNKSFEYHFSTHGFGNETNLRDTWKIWLKDTQRAEFDNVRIRIGQYGLSVDQFVDTHFFICCP